MTNNSEVIFKAKNDSFQSQDIQLFSVTNTILDPSFGTYTNSIATDETPQNEASHLRLYCLLYINFNELLIPLNFMVYLSIMITESPFVAYGLYKSVNPEAVVT